jgi:hypothetical protein
MVQIYQILDQVVKDQTLLVLQGLMVIQMDIILLFQKDNMTL